MTDTIIKYPQHKHLTLPFALDVVSIALRDLHPKLDCAKSVEDIRDATHEIEAQLHDLAQIVSMLRTMVNEYSQLELLKSKYERKL